MSETTAPPRSFRAGDVVVCTAGDWNIVEGARYIVVREAEGEVIRVRREGEDNTGRDADRGRFRPVGTGEPTALAVGDFVYYSSPEGRTAPVSTANRILGIGRPHKPSRRVVEVDRDIIRVQGIASYMPRALFALDTEGTRRVMFTPGDVVHYVGEGGRLNSEVAHLVHDVFLDDNPGQEYVIVEGAAEEMLPRNFSKHRVRPGDRVMVDPAALPPSHSWYYSVASKFSEPTEVTVALVDTDGTFAPRDDVHGNWIPLHAITSVVHEATPPPAETTEAPPSDTTDYREMERRLWEIAGEKAQENDWCTEFESVVAALGGEALRPARDWEVTVRFSAEFTFAADSVFDRAVDQFTYHMSGFDCGDVETTGSATVSLTVTAASEEDAAQQVDEEDIEEHLASSEPNLSSVSVTEFTVEGVTEA